MSSNKSYAVEGAKSFVDRDYTVVSFAPAINTSQPTREPSYRKFTVRLPPPPGIFSDPVEPKVFTSTKDTSLEEIMDKEQEGMYAQKQPTDNLFQEETARAFTQTIDSRIPAGLHPDSAEYEEYIHAAADLADVVIPTMWGTLKDLIADDVPLDIALDMQQPYQARGFLPHYSEKYLHNNPEEALRIKMLQNGGKYIMINGLAIVYPARKAFTPQTISTTRSSSAVASTTASSVEDMVVAHPPTSVKQTPAENVSTLNNVVSSTPVLNLSTTKWGSSLDVRARSWPFNHPDELDVDDGRSWTVNDIDLMPGGLRAFYANYPGGCDAFYEIVQATGKGFFTGPEFKKLIGPALCPNLRSPLSQERISSPVEDLSVSVTDGSVSPQDIPQYDGGDSIEGGSPGQSRTLSDITNSVNNDCRRSADVARRLVFHESGFQSPSEDKLQRDVKNADGSSKLRDISPVSVDTQSTSPGRKSTVEEVKEKIEELARTLSRQSKSAITHINEEEETFYDDPRSVHEANRQLDGPNCTNDCAKSEQNGIDDSSSSEGGNRVPYDAFRTPPPTDDPKNCWGRSDDPDIQEEIEYICREVWLGSLKRGRLEMEMYVKQQREARIRKSKTSSVASVTSSPPILEDSPTLKETNHQVDTPSIAEQSPQVIEEAATPEVFVKTPTNEETFTGVSATSPAEQASEPIESTAAPEFVAEPPKNEAAVTEVGAPSSDEQVTTVVDQLTTPEVVVEVSEIEEVVTENAIAEVPTVGESDNRVDLSFNGSTSSIAESVTEVVEGVDSAPSLVDAKVVAQKSWVARNGSLAKDVNNLTDWNVWLAQKDKELKEATARTMARRSVTPTSVAPPAKLPSPKAAALRTAKTPSPKAVTLRPAKTPSPKAATLPVKLLASPQAVTLGPAKIPSPKAATLPVKLPASPQAVTIGPANAPSPKAATLPVQLPASPKAVAQSESRRVSQNPVNDVTAFNAWFALNEKRIQEEERTRRSKSTGRSASPTTTTIIPVPSMAVTLSADLLPSPEVVLHSADPLASPEVVPLSADNPVSPEALVSPETPVSPNTATPPADLLASSEALTLPADILASPEAPVSPETTTMSSDLPASPEATALPADLPASPEVVFQSAVLPASSEAVTLPADLAASPKAIIVPGTLPVSSEAADTPNPIILERMERSEQVETELIVSNEPVPTKCVACSSSAAQHAISDPLEESAAQDKEVVTPTKRNKYDIYSPPATRYIHESDKLIAMMESKHEDILELFISHTVVDCLKKKVLSDIAEKTLCLSPAFERLMIEQEKLVRLIIDDEDTLDIYITRITTNSLKKIVNDETTLLVAEKEKEPVNICIVLKGHFSEAIKVSRSEECQSHISSISEQSHRDGIEQQSDERSEDPEDLIEHRTYSDIDSTFSADESRNGRLIENKISNLDDFETNHIDTNSPNNSSQQEEMAQEEMAQEEFVSQVNHELATQSQCSGEVLMSGELKHTLATQSQHGSEVLISGGLSDLETIEEESPTAEISTPSYDAGRDYFGVNARSGDGLEDKTTTAETSNVSASIDDVSSGIDARLGGSPEKIATVAADPSIETQWVEIWGLSNP